MINPTLKQQRRMVHLKFSNWSRYYHSRIGAGSVPVLADTGCLVDVNPFLPDCNSLKHVKIVDAAVQYSCPYTSKEYCLVLRNCLYFPSMSHNLIPPSIIREAGVTVNDVLKIHCGDTSTDDHPITLPKYDIKIPLKLMGVFSYFPTTKPSMDFLESTKEEYDLTPIRWDPHD